MKIVVCVKQIPDVSKIKIDHHMGILIRKGVPAVLNPNDKNAIEEAFRLKEEHGGKITAFSMGPLEAEEALREALGMGVDEAILLSDHAFSGADTLATSYTLGCAIKKAGLPDLILCGMETLDGMTAQVGPQLAVFLDFPYITCVHSLKIDSGLLRAKRATENGFQVVETKLPALVTVSKSINQPRVPSMDNIIAAYREKEVVIWKASDLGVDPQKVGFGGSPTTVQKVFATELKKAAGEVLRVPAQEAAKRIVAKLEEMHLL